MALNKHVVVAHLEQELAARAEAQAAAHATAVEKWKDQGRELVRAKRESTAQITAMTTELANPEPDWSALREMAAALDSYRSPLRIAAVPRPPRPELKPTTSMTALSRVVELIKSHDSDTVTVADLRGLGVLDFVRVRGR